MIKVLTLAAAAAAALASGGAAQAHESGAHAYGYNRVNLPAPAYAYDGRSYTVYERPANKGFPLVGANAGVTVLGVHLGGEAKIRLGLDEELQHRRKVYVSRAPAGEEPRGHW